MQINDIQAAIEGILFAAGEPVSSARLAEVLEEDEQTIHKLCMNLRDYYSFERRGVRLIKVGEAYQLCSAPDYADVIRKTLETRKPPKLSQSALEVLTIIAYYQPATRAYVDQIRGVDSSYTVGLLQDRGLIEECGRLHVPGRPILYRTTSDFLRVFGLSTLDELPAIPDGQSFEQLTIAAAVQAGEESTGEAV